MGDAEALGEPVQGALAGPGDRQRRDRRHRRARSGSFRGIALIAGGIYLWTTDDGGAGIAAGALIALVGRSHPDRRRLIIQALKGVFGVALYRFASAGELTPGFTAEDMNSAVRRQELGGAGAAAAAGRSSRSRRRPGRPARRSAPGSSTVQAITCTSTACAACDEPARDQRVVDPDRPDAELRRAAADDRRQAGAQEGGAGEDRSGACSVPRE